jgi:hypothetical protein
MGQKYDIGKVRAKNVAIGSHAKAQYETHTDPKRAAIQAEALHQIRQLIELLAVHSEEIDSPHAVRADAESVEVALKKKKLNRSRIKKLIGNITPAVAGVTALANAIEAVHTAISHL